MPEGDTIYRTAAQLRKALLGKEVTGFETVLPQVENRVRDYPVVGRTVSDIEAHGKHLLIFFAAPPEVAPRQPVLALHSHMRMTGAWHLYRPGESWWKPPRCARVVVRTAEFVAPCFSAPVVELLTEREARRHPDLVGLGPDAITEEFDPGEAKRRMLRDPQVPIGVVLMNQRLLAGVGNIFKSEILFLRRVSPFTPIGELPEAEVDAIVAEAHRLLCLNRERGNRRTRFTLSEQHRLWVYGRGGEPCRVCGATVRMRRQGEEARSTYFCPACQQAPS